MLINMNDRVEVELNEYGKQLLVKHYDHPELPTFPGKQTGEQYCDVVHPQWRSGILKTQLHELFSVFGASMHIGGAIPFVLNQIDVIT